MTSRSFRTVCGRVASATALALGAAALLVSCGQTVSLRPAGNLGDSVNSPGDEFAPALRPGSPDLYFTSNRALLDDIWRAAPQGSVLSAASFSGASLDRSDISRLSQPSTNDGATVFLSADHGFFASGHAPDTLFMLPEAFGGIVGGTDLFEFVTVDGTSRVRNLGPVVNSRFWDSHPAAGIRGDSVLLIFSSDRPDPRGFSSPYSNTLRLDEAGDTIGGNADLFYVFGANGTWGRVRNFAEVEGERINGPKNEYSPFLFCVAERPRLFFATNSSGNYDIQEAELVVDFGSQRINVVKRSSLPAGDAAINSDADELFPFLSPYPLDGRGEQALFLASNRGSEARKVGEREQKSVGGFDLYRFPLSRECRPPKIRLEVTVLDAENPARPVLSPVVRLWRLDDGSVVTEAPRERPMGELTVNPAIFTLDFDSDYALFGGSLHDRIECEGDAPAIQSYRTRFVSEGTPTLTRRTEHREVDTILGGRFVTLLDTIVEERVAIADLGSVTNDAGEILAVRREDDSVIVMRHVVRREVEGGRETRMRVAFQVIDTLRRFDTILVPTIERLAPSERLRRSGHLGLPELRADATIRDTVWVWPSYYQAPPCEWLYTRDVVDEIEKNVPYFQTAFWEVNTTPNLREHRRELDSRRFADAPFIELHPQNSYFGLQTGGKRTARLAAYATFAREVDRNLDRMAEEVMTQIVPEFLEFDAQSPGSNNRLLVQVAAYSDVRPIQRGFYTGGGTVDYLAGGYDGANGSLRLYPVHVEPGASLVSESNDTLSKLRAWYGYRELLSRLERYPRWKELVDSGVILLPSGSISENEYRSRMERAKILVVIEGRNADRSEVPSVTGYVGRKDDFYALDDVRRIDVKVNRLEYVGGRLVTSPCCR